MRKLHPQDINLIMQVCERCEPLQYTNSKQMTSPFIKGIGVYKIDIKAERLSFEELLKVFNSWVK